MSTGFGQWYDEKRAEEEGTANNSSFFGLDSSSTLPLFDNETMQNLSWSNMKASMEAQMPKQIMGMGYQQRFQVQ